MPTSPRPKGTPFRNWGEGGRLYTEQGVQDWKSAKTHLGYGDFIRSKEIAEFFHENNLKLPDEDSALWSGDVDYEDVKLKVIQQEGLDLHDFNIFDDRASLLWRKPWTDGMAGRLEGFSGSRLLFRIRERPFMQLNPSSRLSTGVLSPSRSAALPPHPSVLIHSVYAGAALSSGWRKRVFDETELGVGCESTLPAAERGWAWEAMEGGLRGW